MKRPRNVYAHSLEECEEKLKELILETNGEMADLRSGTSTEYPEDGNTKKNMMPIRIMNYGRMDRTAPGHIRSIQYICTIGV